MERRMGLSNDVLRFMTIRVDEHETEPSVQMKKGGDREDRRGGPRGGGRGGPREGGRDRDRDRDGGGRGGPRGGGGDGSTFRSRPQATDAAEER
jgi:small subunit ribosomal protein S6